MNGRTTSTVHSGNVLSKASRSRSNRIQGSAWLAPESGPSDGNAQSSASGRKGSWWNRAKTRRDQSLTQGSTARMAPPGRTQRAASAKKRRQSGRWWRTSTMATARSASSVKGKAWPSATRSTPGQGNTSEAMAAGTTSRRNPAPLPSSRTAPGPDGRPSRRRPYQSRYTLRRKGFEDTISRLRAVVAGSSRSIPLVRGCSSQRRIGFTGASRRYTNLMRRAANAVMRSSSAP
jgi:hypothetical protein